MPFLRKRVKPAMEYGDWLYIVALCNYAVRTYPGDMEIPDSLLDVKHEDMVQLVQLLTERLEELA